jgi:hypothetical protein
MKRDSLSSPSCPRRAIWVMQPVDKVEQQAGVLSSKIYDPKTTIIL